MTRAAGALTLALAALPGCSGGKTALATVSGVVSLNGTPVDGAKITFFSTAEVDGKHGASFSSLTDSSGKYVIASNGKEPGVPAGVYKVTVVKYEGKGPTGPEGGVDAGQLDAMVSDGGGAKGGPVNLLPKEYASQSSSKLSATLDVGKNENVNFVLKGK